MFIANSCLSQPRVAAPLRYAELLSTTTLAFPIFASEPHSARLTLRTLNRLRRLIQILRKLTLPTTTALDSLHESLRVQYGACRVCVRVVVREVSLRLRRSKTLEQRNRVRSVVDILDFPRLGNLLRIIGKRPVALQRGASPVVARNHAREDGRGFLGFDVGDHFVEIPAESVYGFVDAFLREDCDCLVADAGQGSSVFDVGGWIHVVVVAHFDEDVVSCSGRGEESGPEAFVDEGAGGAAVFGEVGYA